MMAKRNFPNRKIVAGTIVLVLIGLAQICSAAQRIEMANGITATIHGPAEITAQLVPNKDGEPELVHPAAGSVALADIEAEWFPYDEQVVADALAAMNGFTTRVEAVREAFLAYLAEAKAAGRKVAAYGAAAKGNTFLNYCGVTAADIVAAFDANPHKQGRFLPGSHVPIHAPEKVADLRPDDILILPWNLKDEIIGQLAHVKDWGGRFIVAAPEPRVVG